MKTSWPMTVVEIEQVEIVARRAVLGADLDPVVALVAECRQVGLGAEDEVVALAGERLGDVLAGDDEVLAVAADDQVEAVAAVDDVVAGVALEDVVAALVGDDVVAGAALDLVVAVAAFDAGRCRRRPRTCRRRCWRSGCRCRRCRRARRGRRRCSAGSWCRRPAVAGLSRMTSGSSAVPPSVGSTLPSSAPVAVELGLLADRPRGSRPASRTRRPADASRRCSP